MQRRIHFAWHTGRAFRNLGDITTSLYAFICSPAEAVREDLLQAVEAGPELTSTACRTNSRCTRRSPKFQHKGAQQPYQWQLTRTTVSLKTYSRHFHPQPQLSRHPAQGTRGLSKEHATSAASTDTKQSTAVKSNVFC
jgi:hypothetical protein